MVPCGMPSRSWAKTNTSFHRARVPLAGRAETEAAIADAAEAQREWGEWNTQRRARVLLKFLQLVDGERESLARLLSSEHGKTVADAHGDLQRGLAMMAKEAVARSFETTLTEGVRFERRLFHAVFATLDQKEGMGAFVDKRPPEFVHR
ncbi:aldehyde dehydrogenase family protein [Streptomyces tubercidicus]